MRHRKKLYLKMLDLKKTGVSISRKIIGYKPDTTGIIIETYSFDDATIAASALKASRTSMMRCIKKESSSHTAKGYKWRYASDELGNEIWVTLLIAPFRGVQVSSMGRVKSKSGKARHGHERAG